MISSVRAALARRPGRGRTGASTHLVPERSILLVAAIAAILVAPPALAADPVPPNTSWNDPGPNVPTYLVYEIFGSAGSNPVDHFECQVDGGPWEVCPHFWQPWLPGGPHDIAARAVDTTGLADPTPATKSVFVDVEGPNITLVLNEGAAATGRLVVAPTLVMDDHTSVGDIRISNSPEIDEDGLLVNAAGAWVVGPDSWWLDQYGGNNAAGIHTVYVQAKDAFGNWSSPVSDSITFDPALGSPVSIRLSASQNPAPLGGRILVFGVAHPDDGAGFHDGRFEIWIENGAFGGYEEGWTIENGMWVDLSGIPAGTYLLKARFSNSADLDDAETSVSLRVGPELTILGPQASFSGPLGTIDPYNPEPFDIPIMSRYNSATSFQCRIDQGPWSACAGSLPVPVLPVGWHLAEVRGIDSAGRVQAVPETFMWHIGDVPGDIWVDDASRSPDIWLSMNAPDGALAMRMSNNLVTDAQGRLVHARELTPPLPEGGPFEWDLTDETYGGTQADGNRLVAYQFKLEDGTWSTVGFRVVRLDRVAPQITLQVENGSAFVDQDELLAVVASNERSRIDVAFDPAWLDPPHPTSVSDGLDLLALPISDVPLGSVAVRTVYARAWDYAGNASAIVEATVTIDRSSPTTQAPLVTFDVGTQVTKQSVQAWVTAGASDTGSGIGTLAVQGRSGSTWSTIASTSSSTVKVSRTLPIAGTRTFRARGTDRLGHMGSWSTSPSILATLRGDGSSTITYAGSWATVGASGALGSKVHRTSTSGARATLRFSGRAVSIVAPKGPQYGRFEVLVDGVKVATVDLRRSSTRQRMLVFGKSWATPGLHTIAIRKVGGSGRPIAVDGFVYLP